MILKSVKIQLHCRCTSSAVLVAGSLVVYPFGHAVGRFPRLALHDLLYDLLDALLSLGRAHEVVHYIPLAVTAAGHQLLDLALGRHTEVVRIVRVVAVDEQVEFGSGCRRVEEGTDDIAARPDVVQRGRLPGRRPPRLVDQQRRDALGEVGARNA